MRAIAVAAALVVPQAALAELTVEQAWAVWTTQFEALGLDWEAEAERDGAALAVGPIALTLRYPIAEVEMHLQLPGPRFVPDGDAIEVRLPDTALLPFRMTSRIGPQGGETAAGAFEMRMTETTVRMQETEAGIEAQWDGDRFEIDLVDFDLFEAPFPAQYRYVQSGFEITQTSETGEGWLGFDRLGAAESVIVDYGFGDDSTAEGLRGSLAREGVETDTRVRLPQAGPVLKDLNAQAAAGMMFRHEAFARSGRDWDKEWSRGELIAQSETDWTEIRGSFVLSGEGLRVVSGSRRAAMQLTDQELRLNLELEADRVLLDLAMPLLRAVEPQPFALRFDLDQLALSEESWAQFFDPETLPREAADLQIDVAGEMILLETLVDLAAWGAMTEDTLPFMVETLDVAALVARLEDAEITGTGALRFDHTDYETLDGIPATEGQLAFDLRGAQALLDRLADAGLLPGDAAMSTRMMLGMFTKPVEGGEDAARSEIEFRENGQILVNGQRMR